MGKYDDIINLPHHVSDYHKPMPVEHRAAQFAPFAALTGHEDALYETARQTTAYKELSEDERNILSRKLNFALKNNSSVEIIYFLPDKTKSGGSYQRISGKIKKCNESVNSILMKNGKLISLNCIADISIKSRH